MVYVYVCLEVFYSRCFICYLIYIWDYIDFFLKFVYLVRRVDSIVVRVILLVVYVIGVLVIVNVLVIVVLIDVVIGR